jgi:hypothetical protein
MNRIENLPLDRETKILLLTILKQGYFTAQNIKLLKTKIETESGGAFIRLSDGTEIEI